MDRRGGTKKRRCYAAIASVAVSAVAQAGVGAAHTFADTPEGSRSYAGQRGPTHASGRVLHTSCVDFRSQALGPILQFGDQQGDLSIDFGDLVRKLILFDRIILEGGLTALPHLIEKFGYDGIKELLDSGRVHLHEGHLGFGQVEGPRKTPGVHDIGWIEIGDLRSNISYNMRPINDVPGLRAKQAKHLRRLVGERILRLPPDDGNDARTQFIADCEANSPLIREAVALCASQEVGRVIRATEFDLHVEGVPGGSLTLSNSDLSARLGVDTLKAHEIVSKGLLAVANIDYRLELMKRHDCVTGFRPDEVPLYEHKLNYVAQKVNTDLGERRLEQILTLVGLPAVDPDPGVHDVDLLRLLRLLESEDMEEFRSWLRSIDSADDDEVKREVSKVRDAIAAAVNSRVAQVMRFVTTTGIGFIPGAQPIAIGATAIDNFVLDRVLPHPGPTAFLSRRLPSIFRP